MSKLDISRVDQVRALREARYERCNAASLKSRDEIAASHDDVILHLRAEIARLEGEVEFLNKELNRRMDGDAARAKRYRAKRAKDGNR